MRTACMIWGNVKPKSSATSGAGMDFPANEIILGTPSTITGETTNQVTTKSHTHKVENVGSEKIINGVAVEYGNIYNGYTANGTGAASIAKVGWNVVSNAQLLAIQSNLGGSAVAGGKMKEAGLTHWNTPNTGATNESGFNGRGNGYRAGSTGTFYALKEKWSIWTATIDGIKHYLSQLHYNTLDFHVAATWSESEKNGHAIRLAKDTTTLADGETGTYIGNDGKVYPTKCYGTVEIMTCNLAETLLRDGTPIAKASLNAEWTALTGPAYCSCNNDDSLVGGQTLLSAILETLQNTGTPWVEAIAAAIANLVDTAPATLDTLNELAAALGDDPNFATTITNLIAGKLSLDDPRIGNWNWAHAWSHQHSNFLIIEAITAAMTARIGSTLSAFKGLCTNEFGNIISHAVSVNELSFLIGVTSEIQTQLNAKAALAGLTSQEFGVQKLNLPGGSYIQIEGGNIHLHPASGEVVVHGQVTATTFYKT